MQWDWSGGVPLWDHCTWHYGCGYGLQTNCQCSEACPFWAPLLQLQPLGSYHQCSSRLWMRFFTAIVDQRKSFSADGDRVQSPDLAKRWETNVRVWAG